MRFPRLLTALLACLTLSAPATFAAEDSVATVWRLLDYIAVDYREAVQDGAVVNAAEFDEMVEFSATAASGIEALPPSEGRAALVGQAQDLGRSIAGLAAPEVVATQARALAAALVEHHPIPLAPESPPDYSRGGVLYGQLCASCHGDTGDGDGPASEGLDPPAIAFTDRERADERSVFALYQVITQGLEDTSMASYASLPDADRWALATYVGAMAYPESLAAAGRQRLQQDTALRAGINMDRYVGTTPAAMAAELGEDEGNALTAYLRRQPQEVFTPDAQSSLAIARSLLRQSMAAYREGNARDARSLALSAYLDGFEPVEPLLAARDNPLMVQIEMAMAQVRSGIAANATADELQVQVDRLGALFAQAEDVLSAGSASAATSFIAAFTILLREGLEAVLIVVAIIALLRKVQRREMLSWVHAGWASALVAGAATWALATWVISISGASRELSEGFGSALAAVVLVWVGIWMHGKSHADSWQRYVKEKLDHALGRKSGIFLLLLVFVVVYREVFETILFYAAIWNQGSRSSVIAGAGAAALVLVVVTWLLLHYSRRLPISQFFRYSAVLIAVLAVVLTGKAVSALQEAGVLPIRWLAGAPRVELLGLYQTLQGILAQLVMIAVLVAGFLYASRDARTAATP